MKNFFFLLGVFWGISFIATGAYGQSPDSILLERLAEAKSKGDDTARLDVLRKLSTLYLEAGNSIQSLRYSLEWLSRIDDKESEDFAWVNRQIGDIYINERINPPAISYYKKALLVSKGAEERRSLERKIGDAFFDNHQLDSALVYYQVVMADYNQNYDHNGELIYLQQIAPVFELQGDCEHALAYYQHILLLLDDRGEKNEMAIAYNNIGYQYHCLSKFKEALEYFNKAADFCEQDCPLNRVTLLTNLGIASYNDQQFELGTKFLLEALTLAKKEEDEKTVGLLQNMLAKVYYERGAYYEALQMNNSALATAKAAEEHDILKDAYLTSANIYERLFEYDKALDYYQKHLRLRDSLLLGERLRQDKFLQHQFALEQSEKEMKLILSEQEVKDLAFEQLQLEKDKLELETNNLALLADQNEKELVLLRREQEIQEEKLRFEALQALKTQQELSLTQQRLQVADKDKEILNLRETETQQALVLAQKEALQKDKEKEILSLNNDKKLQAIALEQQVKFRAYLFWLLGALGIILLLILLGYLFAKRTNRQLEQQNREIEAQRQQIEEANQQSEQLLLNILPHETALELKTKGYAEPRHYDAVSVLFADFENFTKLTEKLSPSVLIEELNICFMAFDEITGKYGLEKIKTIGDAYMCAGGIPATNKTHVQNTVDAAQEMMQFIQNRWQEKQKKGIPYWKMRIGIHTGAVVAGVVGNKKFAYDIWGDTVNIASRMETSSEPGKINISKNTYQNLPDGYKVEYRGTLPVKNRGEMQMYFVEI